MGAMNGTRYRHEGTLVDLSEDWNPPEGFDIKQNESEAELDNSDTDVVEFTEEQKELLANISALEAIE